MKTGNDEKEVCKKIPSGFDSRAVLNAKYVVPGAGERMAMTVLPPNESDAFAPMHSQTEKSEEEKKLKSNSSTTEHSNDKQEEEGEDSEKKKKREKKKKKKNGQGKDKRKDRTTSKKRPTTSEAVSKIVAANTFSSVVSSNAGRSSAIHFSTTFSVADGEHKEQQKWELPPPASVAPIGDSGKTNNPKPKKKPSKRRQSHKENHEENGETEGEWIKGGGQQNQDGPHQRPSQRQEQQKQKEVQQREQQRHLKRTAPVSEYQQTRQRSQTLETPKTVATTTYGDEDSDYRFETISRVKKTTMTDLCCELGCCCC